MATVEATRAAPESYFCELSDAFDEAAAAAGLVERTLNVGPWNIRLRFAGRELTDLFLRPLASISESELASDSLANVGESGTPDSLGTVSIFDSASTGTPVPAFGWRPRDIQARGEVAGYNDTRFRTIYHGDVLAADGGFNALSMADTKGRHAIFWVASRERVHWWERAEPLRPAFHWLLAGDGRELAHAAVVGTEHGAVMLAGAGGSGKTTTTLACVEAGFAFAGDNYVLVAHGDPPVAHALYRNTKLRPGTLELLPELAAAVSTFDVEEGEKVIVDVGAHRPRQLAAALPIRALVVPQIVPGARTRLVRASPVQALLALAPTTVYQLPANGASLSSLAGLARSIPCYRLELGPDPRSAPPALAELLEQPEA